MTDKHFLWRTFRRRSNEHPWITNAIRSASKKKKRLFRKEGRSRAWRRLTSDLERETRRKREEYVDNAISDGKSGKDFFAAFRKLSRLGSVSLWSVGDLFPRMGDEDVCREVIEILLVCWWFGA